MGPRSREGTINIRPETQFVSIGMGVEWFTVYFSGDTTCGFQKFLRKLPNVPGIFSVIPYGSTSFFIFQFHLCFCNTISHELRIGIDGSFPGTGFRGINLINKSWQISESDNIPGFCLTTLS